MNIDDQIKELKAKLAELEAQKAKEEKPKPTPIENPDFSELIKECQEYIRCLEGENTDALYLEDHERSIFESAVTALYGEQAWAWINERR